MPIGPEHELIIRNQRAIMGALYVLLQADAEYITLHQGARVLMDSKEHLLKRRSETDLFLDKVEHDNNIAG